MWTSLGLFSLGLSVLPGPGYLFPPSHWGSFRPLFLRITSLPFVCLSSFWNSCNVNVSALNLMLSPRSLTSGPQCFWPLGLVQKTVFSWTGEERWFQDDSNTLHLLWTLLLFHQLQLRSSDIWSQRLGIPAGHHWPTENQKLYVWLPCSPISPHKRGYWVAVIWIWSEEHSCCVKEVTDWLTVCENHSSLCEACWLMSIWDRSVKRELLP